MRALTAPAAALSAALLMVSAAHAAGHRATRPTIRIVSPANGAVVHGTQLKVRIIVSGFRLVHPVFKNPPVLKGKAGHIQYELDNRGTFVPTRDATTSLIHTWTDVRPGRHTIIAYLATNHFAPFPGAAVSQVTVRLEPIPRPTPTAAPTMVRGPTTGGAAFEVGAPLNVSLLLAGLLALFVGLTMLLGRREPKADAASAAATLPPASPVPDPAPATTPTRSEEGIAPMTNEPTTIPTALPIPGRSLVPRSDGQPGRGEILTAARRWPGMIEDLVRELDRLEAEGRELRERVDQLEESARSGERLRSALTATPEEAVTEEELKVVQYVMESLRRDPEHIVVLASVAQNANKLQKVVSRYARVHQAIEES